MNPPPTFFKQVGTIAAGVIVGLYGFLAINALLALIGWLLMSFLFCAAVGSASQAG